MKEEDRERRGKDNKKRKRKVDVKRKEIKEKKRREDYIIPELGTSILDL